MSSTRKITGATVVGVLTILAGPAFALSNVSLTCFPTEDGIVPVLPQFSVGGVYPPPMDGQLR